MLDFYIGWHQLNSGESGTKHFHHCSISAPRLLFRCNPFPIQNWILDSGTFTQFRSHGGHLQIDTYINLVKTWQEHGSLKAWVSQDWLYECSTLEVTNLSVYRHQQLTIDCYALLRAFNR
ncbi:hypothetical protein [Chamaesiphon sp. OTE_75_metabat_556]|uniref:deazapurine DNA modification protein DpdA family protein n=1 Tax=Chamaesiphon sp. OTE_75_metabat_556 TaxID=2964692 RepID=UPI00286C4369|nr:hypothetical protein [Chamaesiphon sp. OTE_75_metabat_556]